MPLYHHSPTIGIRSRPAHLSPGAPRTPAPGEWRHPGPSVGRREPCALLPGRAVRRRGGRRAHHGRVQQPRPEPGPGGPLPAVPGTRGGQVSGVLGTDHRHARRYVLRHIPLYEGSNLANHRTRKLVVFDWKLEGSHSLIYSY